MEDNTTDDIFAQLLMALTGETPLSLMFMGVDLILSVVALVLLVIAAVSLLKGAWPGSAYIVFGLAGLMVAVLGLLVVEEGAVDDAIFDLLGACMSAGMAVAAFGFLRLARFLKRERAGGESRA